MTLASLTIANALCGCAAGGYSRAIKPDPRLYNYQWASTHYYQPAPTVIPGNSVSSNSEEDQLKRIEDSQRRMQWDQESLEDQLTSIHAAQDDAAFRAMPAQTNNYDKQ
jgi:hypothetical protein